jgi:GTP-binding protein
MSKPPYQQANFVMSAAALNGLPADEGIEVAFVGRSNAGKSTALNVICGQHRLARTSNTPGRTQLINIFSIGNDRRLIDLPGYGFAKAPKHIQASWQELIDGYLQTRDCLGGLVLLMDIRHPLEPIDRQVLAWSAACNIPVLVLLSKSDKYKFGQAKNTLLQVQREIIHPDATVILFSGTTRNGVEDAQNKLDEWFQIERG